MTVHIRNIQDRQNLKALAVCLHACASSTVGAEGWLAKIPLLCVMTNLSDSSGNSIHASAQLQSLVCAQKHGLDFPTANKLWWNLSRWVSWCRNIWIALHSTKPRWQSCYWHRLTKHAVPSLALQSHLRASAPCSLLWKHSTKTFDPMLPEADSYTGLISFSFMPCEQG